MNRAVTNTAVTNAATAATNITAPDSAGTNRAASVSERAGTTSAQTRSVIDRLQLASPVPLGIHLQISDRCNHSCKHCYQIQGNKGELPTSDWLRVLDSFARDGVLFLTVSGGEATLRPDLVEVLAAARNHGFAVRLFTNAYLIDGALADRLASLHLLAIHVSVYSHLQAEHDAVTRVPGSWKRTTEAVRMLTERGAHVTLKYVAMKGCSSSPAEMRRLAEELHALLETGGMILAREDGSLGSCRAMLDGPELVRATEPDSEHALGEHPCGLCRTSLAVLPDGSVLPCTALQHVLGNARTESLRAIAGQRDHAFLGSLTWGDVHGCRDCDLQRLCARCHADALLQTGDLLGPYESACRYAVARFLSANPSLPGVAGMGPYRLGRAGLERIQDVVQGADLGRRTAFPWIHLPAAHHGMLGRRCP